MTEYTPRPFMIEIAGLNDLGGMRTIEQVCFPQDAWPLLELIAALSLPGLIKLKAVLGDKMVGFVGGAVKKHKGEGWITTLGVLPDFRRLGIATVLLDECEQALGMPVVKLSVRRSNVAAQTLYFNRGYTHTEVWEHYYEGGEDGFVLEKRMADHQE